MNEEILHELSATLGIYKEHFLPLLLPIIERAQSAAEDAAIAAFPNKVYATYADYVRWISSNGGT